MKQGSFLVCWLGVFRNCWKRQVESAQEEQKCLFLLNGKEQATEQLGPQQVDCFFVRFFQFWWRMLAVKYGVRFDEKRKLWILAFAAILYQTLLSLFFLPIKNITLICPVSQNNLNIFIFIADTEKSPTWSGLHLYSNWNLNMKVCNELLIFLIT